MKKYLLILLLIAIVFVISCGKEYTRLIVVFGQEPEGGNEVTLIEVAIVGHLEDGDTPIQARVRWMASADLDSTAVIYWSDTWTFRNTEPIELWAGVQAPEGYVLEGYFWFSVTWEDEDGTPNEVVSDTAFCYNL